MAKRASAFQLMLPQRASRIPAQRWLYSAVRAEILQGRLRPGARLAATRDLGKQYGLSRGTIVGAFEQLESEGYLEGRVGSGTYVSTVLPEEWLEVRHAAMKPTGHAVRPDRALRASPADTVPPLS